MDSFLAPSRVHADDPVVLAALSVTLFAICTALYAHLIHRVMLFGGMDVVGGAPAATFGARRGAPASRSSQRQHHDDNESATPPPASRARDDNGMGAGAASFSRGVSELYMANDDDENGRSPSPLAQQYSDSPSPAHNNTPAPAPFSATRRHAARLATPGAGARRKRSWFRRVVVRGVFVSACVCCLLFSLLLHGALFFAAIFSIALFWCLSHLGFSDGSSPVLAQPPRSRGAAAAKRFAWVLFFSVVLGTTATLLLDVFAPQSTLWLRTESVADAFAAATETEEHGASCVDAFRGAKHIGFIPPPTTDGARAAVVLAPLQSLQLYRRRGSLQGSGASLARRAAAAPESPLAVVSGDGFELSSLRLDSVHSSSAGGSAPLLVVLGKDVLLRNVTVDCRRSRPCLALAPSARLDTVMLRVNDTAAVLLSTVAMAAPSGPRGRPGAFSTRQRLVCAWQPAADVQRPCSVDDVEAASFVAFVEADSALHQLAWPCATLPQRAALMLPVGVGWASEAAQTLFPLATHLVGDVAVPQSKLALRTAAHLVAEFACGVVDAHDYFQDPDGDDKNATARCPRPARSASWWAGETFVCEPLGGDDMPSLGESSNGDNNDSASGSDAPSRLVLVPRESGLRRVVRELSIVVYYFAGSVVWRVLRWCWAAEYAASVWLLAALWRGLGAAAEALGVAAALIGRQGLVAAVAAWPHVLYAVDAAVVPAAGACARGALQLAALLCRAYALYIATWMQATVSVYAALMTPIRFTVSASASAALWCANAGWALVAMVTMRVHFLVFVMQTAALIFVSWHSIPGLAGTGTGTAAAPAQPAGSAAGPGATSLRLMAASLLGPRVTALLNWGFIARLLTHGAALLSALTSYLYTNASMLCLVWVLRWIPLVSYACSGPMEMLVFPVQSALSLADAVRIEPAAALRRRHHLRPGTVGHRRTASSAAGEDDEDGGGDESVVADVAGGGGGVVTRAGVLRSLEALLVSVLRVRDAAAREWVMSTAEPAVTALFAGSVPLLSAGGKRMSFVLARFAVAVLVQALFGDFIEWVIWLVQWALFGAVCYALWWLYRSYRSLRGSGSVGPQQHVAANSAATAAAAASSAASSSSAQ